MKYLFLKLFLHGKNYTKNIATNFSFCKNETRNYFFNRNALAEYFELSWDFSSYPSNSVKFWKNSLWILTSLSNMSSPQSIPYLLNYFLNIYALSNGSEKQKLSILTPTDLEFFRSEFSTSLVHQTLLDHTHLVYKNGTQWISSKVTSPSYLAYQNEWVLSTSFHSLCTTISASGITCKHMSQPPRREIILLSSAWYPKENLCLSFQGICTGWGRAGYAGCALAVSTIWQWQGRVTLGEHCQEHSAAALKRSNINILQEYAAGFTICDNRLRLDMATSWGTTFPQLMRDPSLPL